MRTPAFGVGWDSRRALALLTALAVAASLFMLYTGTARAEQSTDPCYEEVAITQYRYEKQVKTGSEWVRAPEALQLMGLDEWVDDPIDITDRPGGPWTLGEPNKLGNDWYKYIELTREDLRQVEIPCQDVPGHCPAGFTKINLPDAQVVGKTFTADVDYEAVILVGGPPNENNQDPDGRDKYFYDVEAGESVSRVAHDISHVCVIVASTTTTSIDDTTTTSVEDTTTTSVEDTTTTSVEDTTTTSVEDTTTTSVEDTTTTSEEETTTTTEDDPEVLPTVVTTTPDEVDDEELPFTGLDSDVMFGIAVLLFGLGAALLVMTRRVEDES